MGVSLATLPSELRLRIFEYVLLSSTAIHSANVAFGEGDISESLSPNVFVTLPASALISNKIEKVVAMEGTRRGFYNAIAGQSLSLWDTIPLCGVNRTIRVEAMEVWSKHLIKMGTWLSYLATSAPPSLLDSIQVIEFNYWITGKWKPDVYDRLGYAVDAWARSINEVFYDKMEALAEIDGLRWEQLEVQHRLLEGSPFMFRIPAGTVRREVLGLYTRRSAKAVGETLRRFQRQKRWPYEPVVVDCILTEEDMGVITNYYGSGGFDVQAPPQATAS